jgi:hypothetical protein
MSGRVRFIFSIDLATSTSELLVSWPVIAATGGFHANDHAGLCTACPSFAAQAPTDAADATLPNLESLSDRQPDSWQGRHPYLYDDDNLPTVETVGSAPSEGGACPTEMVRMRPSEGTTVIRRLRRCD